MGFTKSYPKAVEFLGDVMITIEDEYFCSHKGEKLRFYRSGHKKRQPFREVNLTFIPSHMRLCRCTNKIYISSPHEIHVFSVQGDLLRDIPMRVLVRSFTVTHDGHLLVCETRGAISVWTPELEFVHEWKLLADPENIVILPHGRVAVSYMGGVVEIF